MWCSSCQQEVPGVAHAASGRIVCPRCQRLLFAKGPRHAARICDDGIALDEPVAAAVAAKPPLQKDDWSNRERVRRLSRELRRPPLATSKSSALPHGPQRFDSPQHFVDQLRPNTAPFLQPHSVASVVQSRQSAGPQIAAWCIVALGTLGFLAGLGLIAWSIAANQLMYWNLALGLTLGGQGTLILGLVLVVSRLWRSSRFAAQRLQDACGRLAKLQQTADALATIRTGGAPTFYADLVHGASPQILLANLKGQVDQLAARLSSGW